MTMRLPDITRENRARLGNTLTSQPRQVMSCDPPKPIPKERTQQTFVLEAPRLLRSSRTGGVQPH